MVNYVANNMRVGSCNLTIIVLLALISCGNSKELERLTEENQALQTENMARAEFIEEYTDVFNKTVTYLEELSGVREEMFELENGEPLDGVSPREQISNQLDLVWQRINTSEMVRHDLEEEVKVLSQKLQESGLETELSKYQEWVVKLKATIEQKNYELEEFSHKVALLQREKEELTRRLAQKQREYDNLKEDYDWLMKQYFVLIDSAKNLRRYGRDDILAGIKTLRPARGLSERQFRRYFQQVDRTTQSITLGKKKKYKVRSLHRRYKDDHFRLVQRRGEWILEITNPDAFWRVSPVLIVRSGRAI